MRYAGFWIRTTAYGIDSIILQILTGLFFYLFGNAAAAQNPPEVQTLINMGWLPPDTVIDPNAPMTSLGPLFDGLINGLLVYTLFSAIYNIVFVCSAWQATPGKRYCKLKVVTDQGEKLNWSQSAVRHLFSGASLLPLAFGYFMIAFSPQKAALHDIVARTRVVHRYKEVEV